MKKGSHTWLLLLASYVLAFGTSADAHRNNDHSKVDRDNDHSKADRDNDHSKADRDNDHSKADRDNDHSKADRDNDHSKADRDNDHSKADRDNDHSKVDRDNDHSKADRDNDHSKADRDNDHSKADRDNDHSKADRDNDHSNGGDQFDTKFKECKRCCKRWLSDTLHNPSSNCRDSNCMDIKEDKHKQQRTGVAVGLLFAGVVIGAVVTAVVCVCVPGLRMRTREKVKGRDHERKSISKENAYRIPRDVDQCVTDNTEPLRTTTCKPKTPTAPVSSDDPDQDGYFSLNEVSAARDAHAYTGLQSASPGQQEPCGEGRGYESIVTQPRRGPTTVVSPVYQEFTDNVIRGNNMDNPNSIKEDQPIRNTDTEDYATNHNYFVLEAQNERQLSNNQYFVLEEQNGKQDTNESVSASDPNNHEYFELKKEET